MTQTRLQIPALIRARANGALARSVFLAGMLASLVACASSGAPINVGNTVTPTPAADRYEGSCAFIGIEEMQGYTDENADAVFLVARYRWPDQETKPAEKPIELAFQVQRSRVNDLQAHLMQYPNVICRPRPGPAGVGDVELSVPPFEGQAGRAPSAWPQARP